VSRDIVPRSPVPLSLVVPVRVEGELAEQDPFFGEHPNVEIRHEDEYAGAGSTSGSPPSYR